MQSSPFSVEALISRKSESLDDRHRVRQRALTASGDPRPDRSHSPKRGADESPAHPPERAVAMYSAKLKSISDPSEMKKVRGAGESLSQLPWSTAQSTNRLFGMNQALDRLDDRVFEILGRQLKVDQGDGDPGEETITDVSSASSSFMDGRTCSDEGKCLQCFFATACHYPNQYGAHTDAAVTIVCSAHCARFGPLLREIWAAK